MNEYDINLENYLVLLIKDPVLWKLVEKVNDNSWKRNGVMNFSGDSIVKQCWNFICSTRKMRRQIIFCSSWVPDTLHLSGAAIMLVTVYNCYGYHSYWIKCMRYPSCNRLPILKHFSFVCAPCNGIEALNISSCWFTAT